MLVGSYNSELRLGRPHPSEAAFPLAHRNLVALSPIIIDKQPCH